MKRKKQAVAARSAPESKNVLISLFIVLNLSTVLFMNRPVWMIQTINQRINYLTPQDAYRINYGSWLIQQYAYRAGLDNAWQMFGRQSRFNWWFDIRGVYANGQSVSLPLPLQSPRTFWQATFFDIKEGKYQLNLYPSEDLRQRYAHYLCRQYPRHDGYPILSITFDLHHQMLLDPAEAVLRKTHLADRSYSRPLNAFTCPSSPL